ncbi:MAG: nitrous oxide-stimulated promoter family protein [Sphaerochaeta sp.]|nr:nitrous oxide-stimulated promoter family protein [Sphaerochaeta sp.]
MDRRAKEKYIVEKMIRMYCKGKKHSNNGLCPSCSELVEYAQMRIDYCPLMEAKSFCSSCPVHCYNTEMRQRIRVAMRYSGPRMVYHHPLLALAHLMHGKRRL